MWAAQLVRPGQIRGSIVSSPSAGRQLQSGELLVRVLAGGICGSDVPKFAGRSGLSYAVGQGRFSAPPPGFPLHEVVGEVIRSASPAHDDNDRIVGWAATSNGLADEIVTLDRDVYTISPRLDPLRAVLIQPLACVINALNRVDVRNRDVLVLGLGPIGLLFSHVARQRGARSVIGVDPIDRSVVASVMGLDECHTIDSSSWINEESRKNAAAITIEAVGHQRTTLADAIDATAEEGTVLYFGIPLQGNYPIDMERMTRKNLRLICGVTRDRRAALKSASFYLASHPELYGALVSHVFGRADVQAAYEMAARRDPGRIKVLIDLG